VAGVIAEAGRNDAGAFLARLLRLDPDAPVRLRPAAGSGAAGGPDVVDAWARLPFGVLVTRRLRAAIDKDVTVPAGALLAALERDGALPAATDHAWRWPLPPGPGEPVEALPAAEVRRIAAAAAATLRAALTSGVGGRAVGGHRLRDALLDHVPFVVDRGTGGRVEVSQRLVQGLARMGFIGDDPITVRVTGPWVGLHASYGSSWYCPNGQTLTLLVSPYRPNG
jgi:hypothetical protein